MSDPSVWPQPVALAEILTARPSGGTRRHLVADTITRQAIAKFTSVEAIERLSADIELSPWLDGVSIRAEWRADIVQICGVTLEPFVNHLLGRFIVCAVPAGSPNAPVDADEAVIEVEADDPPDVLDGDTVDLGRYVVEHLALEIDPFARKPGAEFSPPEPRADGSPFDALRGLKPKLQH